MYAETTNNQTLFNVTPYERSTTYSYQLPSPSKTKEEEGRGRQRQGKQKSVRILTKTLTKSPRRFAKPDDRAILIRSSVLHEQEEEAERTQEKKNIHSPRSKHVYQKKRPFTCSTLPPSLVPKDECHKRRETNDQNQIYRTLPSPHYPYTALE